MAYGNGIKGKPSSEEMYQYKTLVKDDAQFVASVLYHYLYLDWTMNEIEDELCVDEHADKKSMTISLITRCNGFYFIGAASEEHGRYYNKNTKGSTQRKPLMDKHGSLVKYVPKQATLELTYEDFLDFVYAHPLGEDDYIIMDYFMIDRDNENRGITKDEDIFENENFRTWNDRNSYANNQRDTGGTKQIENSLVGRIGAGIVAILLIFFILGQVLNVDIGFGGIVIVLGIIYLIVRKKKSLGQSKQNNVKNNSYTYSPNNQYNETATKRRRSFVFKPSKGGVVLLIIMCLWAMSGFANGGSPIICLIMVLIGLSGVIKKQ